MLETASDKLDKKANIGLMDIGSFMAAGLPGLIGEKIARSPGAAIATAKGLNAFKGAMPAISGLAKGARPAIINAATPRPTTQQ